MTSKNTSKVKANTLLLNLKNSRRLCGKDQTKKSLSKAV